MAATFPGGVKVFTTKQAGDQIASAHINDLQAEVVAVETELRKTTGSVVSHGSLAGLSNNDHPQYLLSASTNYPRADGWIPVSDTWTYASATTITVPSGAASIYNVGMGIRLTANSVVKQAYIVKVENTKLTVAGDALTDHTFSAKSYAPNPQTALWFPVWFSYTPTITATSGAPICSPVVHFAVDGKTTDYRGLIYISDANGATGDLLLTMPTPVYNDGNGSQNIGVSTNRSALGMAFYTDENSRLRLSRYDGATFIATGAAIVFHIRYKMA